MLVCRMVCTENSRDTPQNHIRIKTHIYVDVPGPVEAISTLDEGKGVVKGVITANTSGKKGGGANKIIHFNLSDRIPDSK